jgi:hypothetical protein
VADVAETLSMMKLNAAKIHEQGQRAPTDVNAKIFEPFLPSVSRLRLVSRRSRRAVAPGWG